jgi:hypothetical protein
MTDRLTSELTDAQTVIHNAPTQRAWETVLVAAIETDALKDLLDRLGRIDDVVESMSANSLDPELCHIEFSHALETVVSRWTTASPQAYQSLERLLTLIGAFTPPSGFQKVLAQMERYGHFLSKEEGKPEDQKQMDEMALYALQQYFPAPPANPKDHKAFDAYVDFLADRAIRSSYKGFACANLFALNIWTPWDALPIEVMKASFVEIISPLVHWLLTTEWHDRLTLLSRLYGLSLGSSSTRESFENALREHSALIAHGDMGPAIILNNSCLPLTLASDDFYAYMTIVRDNRQVIRSAQERLEEFAREVFR